MIEASSQAKPLGRRSPSIVQGRLTWNGLALGLHAVLIYAFLYVPIAILVIFSFTQDEFGVRWTGFTLDWYVRLFNNDRLMEAALNTLMSPSSARWSRRSWGRCWPWRWNATVSRPAARLMACCICRL